MKKDYTEILVVLDASGSMEAITKDTIGGFNQFLDEQKLVPGTAKITLAMFNDRYKPIYVGIPIGDAKHLTKADYRTTGATCLYGAMGRTMEEAGSRFTSMPEWDKPEKVICLTITDGEENSSDKHEWSQRWNTRTLRSAIELQQNIYKWQFVFIGANQNAILSAQDLGINPQNALDYTANPIGTQSMYRAASANTRAFRGGQSVNMAFSADQKMAQEKAKNP